jgi:hypothetical protein
VLAAIPPAIDQRKAQDPAKKHLFKKLEECVFG